MTRSILFFALPRGASSVTGRILHILSAGSGMSLSDLEGKYYNIGIPLNSIPQSEWDNLNSQRFFYGPFRSVPNALWDLELRDFRHVVLFRDPRDCVVSSFFSTKYLHTVFEADKPLGNMKVGVDIDDTIDEFVLGISTYYRNLINDLLRLISRYPDCIALRYEDIYSRPLEWIQFIIERLCLEVDESSHAQAALEADFSAEIERPTEHKRQGLPGDHVRKLKPATREMLSRFFERELDLLGYAPLRDFGPFSAPARELGNLAEPDRGASRTELRLLRNLIKELQTENGYRIEEIAELKQKIAASTNPV